MHNNSYRPQRQYLSEGLEYRDLVGIMKPTIHVDEFSSKMGDDDDVIVISFFVRDKQAARDLMSWFEKGYDFILDSDRSPGEIKPNRYLVYVEIRRRSTAPGNIQELLSDLETLTEFEPEDWLIHHNNRVESWSEDNFARMIPLTPDAYQQAQDSDLNNIRDAAGIPAKKIHKTKPDMKELQAAAGIDVSK